MRKLAIFVLLFAGLTVFGQRAELLKQVNLKNYGCPPANYSGITPMGGNRYAVVSDKEPLDGFYVWQIRLDPESGRIVELKNEGFRGRRPEKSTQTGMSFMDGEGITYAPAFHTIFISDEATQTIQEYDTLGHKTGRQLAIPSKFSEKNIRGNNGFESLAYNEAEGLFWTTTEATLPADGAATDASTPTAINRLRLLSFGKDLKPAKQYAYRMEAASLPLDGRYYALGVADLTALPNGQLLVLERELNVPANYLGSKTHISIYLVNPAKAKPIDDDTDLRSLPAEAFMPKRLVADFTTAIRLGQMNYGNFEGMCLGPRLADGRQSLLLVCDSQAGAGNSFYHLKDYIKVVILPKSLSEQ